MAGPESNQASQLTQHASQKHLRKWAGPSFCQCKLRYANYSVAVAALVFPE